MAIEAGRYGSGREVARIEDEGLLKGEGRYTDDVVPAGQLRAVFVRSPYPHARIASIDTSQARAMPGVKAVVTGEQLVSAGVKPIPGNAGFKRADGVAASPVRWPLAVGHARYAGEAVALVVA